MTSAAGRWGAVQVRVVEEHVGVRTDWTVRDDNHVVIAHLHGSVRDIETEVDGVGASVAPLRADEVSHVPAGRRYRAQATGGLIRYAELRVAPDAGMHGGSVRLGHRDAFLHRSIQRLADLIARTDDVARMAGHSVSHATCLHVQETYGAAAETHGPALSAGEIRRLRSYIRSRLDAFITLTMLSDLVGLTTHQLLIAFRQAFGTTPAQYVIAQRLDRARWLLTHTAYDISTIAAATGFASHSHLTTTFKRHEGITPASFRLGRR